MNNVLIKNPVFKSLPFTVNEALFIIDVISWYLNEHSDNIGDKALDFVSISHKLAGFVAYFNATGE